MKKNKNNYKVYKHTNLINGKIYIGETCEAFVTRSKLHYINIKILKEVM